MMRKVLLMVIRIYQVTVSPLLPCTCRYLPSCSEYTRQALIRHGIRKGAWRALKRMVRCNPLFPGGYDPLR